MQQIHIKLQIKLYLLFANSEGEIRAPQISSYCPGQSNSKESLKSQFKSPTKFKGTNHIHIPCLAQSHCVPCGDHYMLSQTMAFRALSRHTWPLPHSSVIQVFSRHMGMQLRNPPPPCSKNRSCSLFSESLSSRSAVGSSTQPDLCS